MKAIDNITSKIEKWYQGKYIPPPPNDPSSQLIRCSGGHYEKPLLAKGIHHSWIFWKKTWYILLPLIITIILTLYIHHSSNSTSKTEHEKNETKTERHINNPPPEHPPRLKNKDEGAVEVIKL